MPKCRFRTCFETGCRAPKGATAGLPSSVFPEKSVLHCWASQQWHPFSKHVRTPTFLLILTSLLARGTVAEVECPIVPPPKVYRDSGRMAAISGPETVAIVLGAKATEPERYAAERLQTLIQRRFQKRLPVQTEDAVSPKVRQVLLLGQRSTNSMLDKLCSQQRLDLGPESPGPDGFVIRVVEDGGRQVVLIGGSNARGVIYGQEAFFDLLRYDGEKIVFPVVAIRDWPSIPWRGRPHSVVHQHLVPGAMDAYVRSRLNFTDVRDNPAVKATMVLPARKASMGFPAGVELDKAVITRVVTEAHRRGMFVYGTVSCGVGPDKFTAVEKTFEELITLGVDGLWLSFDDTGTGGADALALIRRMLDFGKRHAMTGREIAITPPALPRPRGSYEYIDTEFNRQAAVIPGFDAVQWFFTRVPCKDDVKTARQIGIKSLPGWWHNLVGIQGGFLHNGGIVCTLRADQKPGYLDMQPLARGWHSPDYEKLRDGAENTDAVLLWGLVGGWPEEYEMGALGLWAWDPARHDWQATRRSVYGFVFGPSQVETAREFDDKLAELKSLFHLPVWRFKVGKDWPCRLKQPGDRPQAIKLLDELDALHGRLQSQAPRETGVDPARLESVYLEPMKATLVYARKMALLDYPEYTLAAFENEMFELLASGKTKEAAQALESVRGKVKKQVARVAEELQGLKAIDDYVAFWEKRVSGMDHWKRRAAERRTEMQARFKKLAAAKVGDLFPYRDQVTGDELAALFRNLAHPPLGEPLAEIGADQWLGRLPRWRGAFAVGPFEVSGRTMVAVGYPRRIPSEVGQYAEVCTEVVVPKFEGRLFLDAFVNDTRVDNRWPQFRFLQLWVGDQMVWEEDIAPTREGREWVSVDVTELAKATPRLKLRFRVIDKRPVGDHLSVAFLGPVRFRAGQ